jgi:exonuclease SbcD
VKFVHTSDIHLDPANEPNRKLGVLEEICGLAKATDCLIVAGDLFESAKAGMDERFRRQVDGCFAAIAPTPVVLIPGNHDLNGVDSAGGAPVEAVQGWAANVHVLAEAPFQVAQLPGLELVAIPFQRGAMLQTLLSGLSSTPATPRVLVAHGTVVDRPNLRMYALDEEGGDMVFSNRELEQASPAYVALGHIHKRDQWSLSQGGLAAYPGSPDMRNVKEIEPRSINIVELDPATSQAHVQAHELTRGARSIKRSVFCMPGHPHDAIDAVIAAVEAVAENMRPTIYIRGLASQAELSTIQRELEGRWAQRAVAPTLKFRVIPLEEAATANSLLTTFLARMAEKAQESEGDQAVTVARATRFGLAALIGDASELTRIFDAAGDGETDEID